MRYLVLLGRILFASIFIMAAPNLFSAGTVGYAAAKGLPFASILVPIAGIIALVGGLSVALGYKAKWGAWLLILFLLPVTFTMHAFWSVSDSATAQMEMGNFLKNLSLVGAALLITHFGAGPVSVDEWLALRATALGSHQKVAA